MDTGETRGVGAMATEEKQEEDQAMEPEETKEAKEPEPPKELETDAGKAQPFLKAGQCCFLTEDTTMNVLPTVNGKLLMALGDGGFQYLLAGARANVGIKAGRYFFEVMIAEVKNLAEPQGRAPGPKPKHLVRVGVSTSSSGLLLGPEETESVSFDSSGCFINGPKKELISKKFTHSQVAGVLVNLDPKSPNANTISLFVNGERACEPKPIPESMKGKALFPAVSFRNVTLQVHFGATLLRSLPFTCHSWLQVQKSHSEVKSAVVPKDGKYEVLLPVGLPDEGTFDWVDQFLSKNKNYTELSDRAIIDWANKSGLQKYGGSYRRSSNDKPEIDFGLQLMEDSSVSNVMKAVANVLPRNFIIPEVKANLTAEERSSILARFPGHCYKKVAKVMLGEPPQDYKTFIQQALLKEKKEAAEAELARKKEEAARKKAQEEQRKARQKKEEAAKAEGKEGEKEKDEAGEAEGDAAEEEVVEEEVKVELTAEEKKLWFRPKEVPDLTSKEMSSSYQKFTLPSKEEGYDELTFMWYKEAQSKEYLKKWVLERKMTQRVEDLQPSEWFRSKYSEWNKVVQLWKKKQSDSKDPHHRKAWAARKAAEEKAKKGDEVKEDKEDQKEENGKDEEMKEEKEVKPEEAEEKNGEKPEAAEEEPEMKIDAESLDPFAVEDVMDIGSGEPLFFNFAFEDWTLLSLRFELHLLCHAFRHDLDDPERPTFKENHLAFYFNKYFRRPLSLKNFGVDSVAEVLDLIKDTVELSQFKSLEPQLSDDSPLENFVRLTEDARRDRHLRIDSGDETALLKFQRNASHAAANFGKGGPGKGAASFRQPPPGGRPGFGYGAGRPQPVAPQMAAANRPAPPRQSYAQKRPMPAPAPSNFPAKSQRTSYSAPAATYQGTAAGRYGRSSPGGYGGNSQGYNNAYNRR